MICIPVTRILY